MATPPFLIIADRGTLKAFTVGANAGRGPSAQLVTKETVEEAHGRFSDRFSDQAGSFPGGGTSWKGNGIAERQGLTNELEARILRLLAEKITALLQEHQPSRWAFAAPAEINQSIIDGLDPQWRDRLARNVPRDLTKTDTSALLPFFERPAA